MRKPKTRRQARDETETAMLVCAFALAVAVLMLVMSPAIHKWEREAGYPYGKLCDVFQSCKR